MKSLSKMSMTELINIKDLVLAEINHRREIEGKSEEIEYNLEIYAGCENRLAKIWVKTVTGIDMNSLGEHGLHGTFIKYASNNRYDYHWKSDGTIEENTYIVIYGEGGCDKAVSSKTIVALRAKKNAEFKCYSGYQKMKGRGFEIIFCPDNPKKRSKSNLWPNFRKVFKILNIEIKNYNSKMEDLRRREYEEF